uniref:Uncharacterized protein n=1 Tax=Knipowitschia caucasica TaxID=637954 RepID=A0AAV2L8W5_KNICA
MQEELKKLYSQLEIYKRKKMLANNPHLQKKRSSKKGLGRSLMRRITEIPESVHRQCSREDKDFGEHGSNRNSICMLKKNPFDPSHAVKPVKEETIVKNTVFSLKKSHSSYDHVRDQCEDSNNSTADKMEVATAEGSLLETLMGKTLVQRKSDENINVPSESAESVPLVCKSASAHNLTADKKPIHPRASMLQKSLSVIASAKERTLGLTGKMQSTEDSGRKTLPRSKESKSSVAPDSETKLVIQTPDAKPTVTKSCMAKPQVSSSQPVMCPDPVKSKEFYDLSEVCPWEVEEVHTPSENKVQKHVSIAPNETTTIHGGAVSRGKTQPQRKKGSDVNVGGAKETPKTSAMRADVCPWENMSGESGLSTKTPGHTPGPTARSPLPPESKQADVCPWDFDNDQKTSEQVGSAEKLKKVKKSTVTERAEVCPWDFDSDRKTSEQLRSKDTTMIEKESSTTQRADICPWDFDEARKTEPVSSTDSAKKGTSPVEPRGKSALCEPSKPAGSLQLPMAKADVCPWDYDSTALPPHSQKTPSPSTSKESPSRKMGCLMPRTIEASKEDDKSKLKSQDKLRSTDKSLSSQKMAEVCPWEVESEEAPLVEKRRSTNLGAVKAKAEVCPWEFEEATQASGRDRSYGGVRQTSPSGKIQADVCPWDFDDSVAKKA